MKTNQLTLLITSILLGVYTLALIGLELATSQEHVRLYFTDIRGPVKLYAINTSLSVFFLWATALLYLLALNFLPAQGAKKEQRFFITQILIFGYLGADDRFMGHEIISNHIMCYLPFFSDYAVLLIVAAAELLSLCFLGRNYLKAPSVYRPLLLGALLFGVMIVFDSAIPQQMLLRLSIEDLCKLWGAFCFLLVAWAILSLTVEAKCQANSAEFRVGRGSRVD